MTIAPSVFRMLMAFALALVCVESTAQTYPSRPIRIIVGYPPGGANDILARIIAPRLSERLGQPAIVENKPGADAAIATEYVSKSAPDGHILLVSAMTYSPDMYGRLPYDPAKDFTPITMLVSDPLVFAVHQSVPATSIKELIALAKAKPGSLSYGSGAPPFYVATELFKKQTGVDIVFIPYKGSGPSINAAVAGEVPMVVVTQVPALSQLRSGKIRALAVTSAKRTSQLPDVPSMSESGLDFQWLTWIGLFAPARLPEPILDKIYGALSASFKSDSLQKQYAAIGYDVREGSGVGMPPAEFAPFFQASLARWTNAAKELKGRTKSK
ncbi:MAG: tripartite tricarboxylate transporter substrate binding protein [Betaproteobacteria bacterium]|nr:tripartite tricarboxylate transporter substrate binding protein [Betaproteobacteria bacterium]